MSKLSKENEQECGRWPQHEVMFRDVFRLVFVCWLHCSNQHAVPFDRAHIHHRRAATGHRERVVY